MTPPTLTCCSCRCTDGFYEYLDRPLRMLEEWFQVTEAERRAGKK